MEGRLRRKGGEEQTNDRKEEVQEGRGMEGKIRKNEH